MRVMRGVLYGSERTPTAALQAQVMVGKPGGGRVPEADKTRKFTGEGLRLGATGIWESLKLVQFGVGEWGEASLRKRIPNGRSWGT